MAMELIYQKEDSFNDWNREAINQMEGVHKLCSPCNIECREVSAGKWGIGLNVNDSFLLLDPLDLVSSIYKSEFDLSLKGDDKVGTFIVECTKQTFCYEWMLTHTALRMAGHRYYTFNEYQSKISEAANKLYEKVLDGAELAYQPIDVDREGLELCVKQLAIKWVMPSNYKTRSSDITIDSFIFTPGNDVEKYHIALGNRGFQSWISDWCNDYDEIRHQLENYIYNRESSVKLDFDTVLTKINFQHRSLLKSIEESEGGYGFKYDELCLVTIETDDIGKSPVLKGYCDEKATIRNFYEGLLLMCLKYPMECDVNIYDISLLNAYNKVKSPIVEQWLSEQKRDYSIPIKRQTVVNTIWVINPDYDVCIEEITAERIPWDIENDTFDNIGNYKGDSFRIDGFSAWSKELRELIIKSETGKEYEFDWADFHKRGLQFAKELRSKLPSYIDLWYKAPFEDKSGIISRPILIL